MGAFIQKYDLSFTSTLVLYRSFHQRGLRRFISKKLEQCMVTPESKALSDGDFGTPTAGQQRSNRHTPRSSRDPSDKARQKQQFAKDMQQELQDYIGDRETALMLKQGLGQSSPSGKQQKSASSPRQTPKKMTILVCATVFGFVYCLLS